MAVDCSFQNLGNHLSGANSAAHLEVEGFEIVRLTRSELALILLGCLFWFSALASTFVTIPKTATIFDATFGYGPLITEYYRSGTFRDCTYAVCDTALKMPFLLYTDAWLGKISTSLRDVAIFKDILLFIVTIGCSIVFYRIVKPGIPTIASAWIAVLALFVCSLPLAKHAGHIEYEEGISIPLFYVLGLLAPVLLSSRVAVDNRAVLSFICLISGAVLYLTKPALLLVFGWTIAIALWVGVRNACHWLAFGALAATFVPLSWGLHTLQTSGRFALSTSMVGSDFLRAWNEDTAHTFPRVSVDRTLDSSQVRFADGSVSDIKPKPARKAYANEWEWSDGNNALAREWIRKNPTEAANLTLRKLGNYLFSLRKTPGQVGVVPEPGSRGADIQNWAIAIWLVYGRLAAGGALLVGALLWRNMPHERLPLLAIAALNLCWAVPCVIGYNSERHITAGLCLMLASAIVPLAIALRDLPRQSALRHLFGGRSEV